MTSGTATFMAVNIASHVVNLCKNRSHGIRQKKIICVFHVFRPYLGFCPDPKQLIANFEETIVKYAVNEKWGKCSEKCNM